MKTSILLFTIFSLISASKVETSVIEKIQCLITNEVLYEYAVDIYEIIKTKDVVKIITALVEAYPVIQEEVLKCWNKEVALFSTMRDLAVEKKKPTECESKCWGSCMHIKNHFKYVVCAEDCIKKNCKNK
jgi:DNA polymerase II small subunit/DNA polymerase delta subunit B